MHLQVEPRFNFCRRVFISIEDSNIRAADRDTTKPEQRKSKRRKTDHVRRLETGAHSGRFQRCLSRFRAF